ncbi:f-box kelch-repeat protein [Lasius niger]|uniref:F-box kelch-repeat protein n=1 Tax=Lasius niger TaxID=67767 RepID=A0A0J7MZA4_LASNI|nr:f-box kelch-repeat protein [Lasius niger]
MEINNVDRAFCPLSWGRYENFCIANDLFMKTHFRATPMPKPAALDMLAALHNRPNISFDNGGEEINQLQPDPSLRTDTCFDCGFMDIIKNANPCARADRKAA